ncbi:S-layer homology domain-containing protein [Brevibacillus sp. SYSU BS000544]|uniref:NHL domain-containing protein n=1 Tax=Brevibacillus sp. SYSU BS000544 TaxID=3416443 RepID=UPI003CE5C177
MKLFKWLMVLNLVIVQLFMDVSSTNVAQAAVDINDNYTISTVAGTGVAGNKERAMDLKLAYPNGVAIDADGSLYFADFQSHRIRKLDQDGQVTTIAGSNVPGQFGVDGQARAGQLNAPRGIFLYGKKLYIVDSSNHRIMMVDLDTGILTKVVGDGTSGYSGDGGSALSAKLNNPQDVTVDKDGNVYIADYGNFRIRKVDTNGTITTLAGVGTYPASGSPDWVPNGIPATSAKLHFPYSVTTDKSGNVYFGTAGNTVQKVDNEGKIWTIAGNGNNGNPLEGAIAKSAPLGQISSIRFHPVSNDMYIVDGSNKKIRRIDQDGKIWLVAGTASNSYNGDGSTGTTNLVGPNKMDFDASGNIYFSDQLRIRKITTDAQIVTLAGSGSHDPAGRGPATSAQLNEPTDVAVDSSNNLFLSDSRNHRVMKVPTDGLIMAYAGTEIAGYSQATWARNANFNTPTGLAVRGVSSLLISDTQSYRIRSTASGAYSGTIDSFLVGNGTAGFSGDGGNILAAQLNEATGVAIDPSFSAYFIADTANNRIRKVSGLITTFAGNGTTGLTGDGASATNAGLNAPRGVAADSKGNVYIADTGNHAIRKVAKATGIITTFAGTGAAGYSGDGGQAVSAELNSPWDVFVDKHDNLYIADTGNHTIRRIDQFGQIMTVAGDGAAGFGGDGGSALTAQLNGPTGVFVTYSGEIFIADRDNHLVRKVVQQTIAKVSSDKTEHIQGTAATVAVTVNTFGVANGKSATIQLLDSNGAEAAGVQGTNTISGNLTMINLSIPDTTAIGNYRIKVQVEDAAEEKYIGYSIKPPVSKDATLKDLTVGGVTVSDFASATENYDVVLPYGTTVVPAVVGVVNDTGKANAVVTPAPSLPGTTTIKVTAEDGVTTKTYKVNFTLAKNPAKAITSFTFGGLNPTVSGTIDETAKTVAVTVPYGTNITNLVPTIVFTGASISPNSDVQQDFTNPVTYTVTAEDGSKENYIVTVSTVPLTYTIASIGGQTLSELTVGYTSGSQETKTVTITRIGTGDLENLAVGVSDTDKFELVQPLEKTLNAGTPSTSFTIKAKDGLTEGTHTATISVSADKMTPVTFTVTQVVKAKDAPALTYTIASIGDQTLADLTVDYTSGSQETKTVTITRTGTGDLENLAVDISDTDKFELVQPLEKTLNAGTPSTSFAVKAKDGLTESTYTATVTVSADKMTPVMFTVTQVVKAKDAPALTYTIASIGDQTLTEMTVDYTSGSQESRSVTITRTGTGDLENLAVTVSDPAKFELEQPLVSTLNEGTPSTSFTVKAKDGLTEGTYTATITVSADKMTPVTFTVTQMVKAKDAPALTYTIAPIGNQSLRDLIAGYASGSQESKPITITRTGTGDLKNLAVTVSDPAKFELEQPLVNTLNEGTPSTSFTIKTKDGLTEGTYTATFTISADNMTPLTFTVTQVVKAQPPQVVELTSVQNPAPITGIPNGTAKTAAALGLPSQVEASLSNGYSIMAEVSWAVAAANYDPENKEKQTFTVSGDLMNLPNGVTNPQNLGTSIQVTVKAANAENREIISVTNPAPITGLPNGTAKSASALGLPEQVDVTLDDESTLSVSVKWDVASTDYQPESKDAQRFSITGRLVKLPDGISNSKNHTASIQVSVEAADDQGEIRKIEKVIQPEDITDVENGTRKTASALGLPKKVKAILDNGETIRVEVKWDVEDADYNPDSRKRQKFTVEGNLINLSDGVENPEKLGASVQVTVDAAPRNDRDDDKDDKGSNGGTGVSTSSGQVDNQQKESTRQVKVEAGADDSLFEYVEITRKSSKSKQIDEVVLDRKKAREILKKAAENNKDVVRIVIDNLPHNPADEVSVKVSDNALGPIKEQQVKLEIKTDEVTITLPRETVTALPEDELIFRVVPIRKSDEEQIVTERALQADMVKQAANGQMVEVVGKPMVIETNYQNRLTRVMFPLQDVKLPTDRKALRTFLASLAVFVEYTNGETELKSGTIQFEKGNPVGIEIETKRFNTFTILSLEGKQEQVEHTPYMTGYPNRMFQPDGALTRAEMAAILAHFVQTEGQKHPTEMSSAFPDVPTSHWAAKAIQQISSAGLMKGDGNGLFHPNAKITRAEMATIIARWKELSAAGQATVFGDTKAHWASASIDAVAEQGIMKGYEDGSFRPNQKLTRAEAVTLFNRLTRRGPLVELQQAIWPDVPLTHWAFSEIAEATLPHTAMKQVDGTERMTDN